MSDTINGAAVLNFSDTRVNGKGNPKAIKYSSVSRENFDKKATKLRKKIADMVAKVAKQVEEKKDDAAFLADNQAEKLANEQSLANVTLQADKVIKKYGKVIRLDTLLNGFKTIAHLLDKSKPKPIKLGHGQFKLLSKNMNALTALENAKLAEFATTDLNGQTKLSSYTSTPNDQETDIRVGNYMAAMFGSQDHIKNEVKDIVKETPVEDELTLKVVDNRDQFGRFPNTDPLDDFKLERVAKVGQDLGVTTRYMDSNISPDERDLGIEALDTEIIHLQDRLPKLEDDKDIAKKNYDNSEAELKRWQEQLQKTKEEVERRKAEKAAAMARELAVLRKQEESVVATTDEFRLRADENLQKAAALREEVARLMADATGFDSAPEFNEMDQRRR